MTTNTETGFLPSVARWCLIIAVGFLLGACGGTGGTTPPNHFSGGPAPYGQSAKVSDSGAIRSSLYLPMRDGVNIAVDVYLPNTLMDGERAPTILYQTRYWRALDYRWPMSWFRSPFQKKAVARFAERFLASGYAWVSVDARGTGASYGSRPFSHADSEVRDGAEIVDWIIQQPWSNGLVGALGVSYSGTSAEFLITNQHPAVKAAAPMFSFFDAYADIAFPGGIHLSWFTETWSQLSHKLDRNVVPFDGLLAKAFVKGVRPVDIDHDGALLERAIQDHSTNWNPHKEALGIMYRDDSPPSKRVPSIDALSPHNHLQKTTGSGVAVYSYSGWFDGAYQRAAIRRYLTLGNSKNKLIIGPWDHGGRRNISPFSDGTVRFDHVGELLKFFDYHVGGIDTGIAEEYPIHYFTMGEEQWKATATWPPPAKMVPFYFSAGGRLSTAMPDGPDDRDEYQVDYTAGTGEQSRWYTLIGRPITNPYPDRQSQDDKLLCYTSDPLERDKEVTGHPMATLYVTSTAADGNFFVYLEDIDETGHVTYVTEGMLRARHRRFSSDARPYQQVVPYRSFKRSNSQLLVEGEAAELTFDLLPTSYLFKKGHRIRIALAGADRDHFFVVPPTPPRVTYHRNRAFPSRVELPVVTRSE